MPNPIVPAAAPGLPSSTATRRTILAGLAVAAVAGLPSFIATARKDLTVDEREQLLDAYDEWLFYERRMLHVERFGLEKARRTEGFIPCTRAHLYHFPCFGEPAAPAPSTRAEALLASIGCIWRAPEVA